MTKPAPDVNPAWQSFFQEARRLAALAFARRAACQQGDPKENPQ